MVTLLNICVALLAGLLMSRLAKVIKLPAVTGYLVAGILIGPYCLGQLGELCVFLKFHSCVMHSVKPTYSL